MGPAEGALAKTAYLLSKTEESVSFMQQKKKRGRSEKYGFSRLDVGDTIILPWDAAGPKWVGSWYLKDQADRYAKKTGKKFIYSGSPQGLMIRRIS